MCRFTKIILGLQGIKSRGKMTQTEILSSATWAHLIYNFNILRVEVLEREKLKQGGRFRTFFHKPKLAKISSF